MRVRWVSGSRRRLNPVAKRRRKRKQKKRLPLVSSLFGEKSNQLSKIVYCVPRRFRAELVHEANRRRVSVGALCSQVIEAFIAESRSLFAKRRESGPPLERR